MAAIVWILEMSISKNTLLLCSPLPLQWDFPVLIMKIMSPHSDLSAYWLSIDVIDYISEESLPGKNTLFWCIRKTKGNFRDGYGILCIFTSHVGL